MTEPPDTDVLIGEEVGRFKAEHPELVARADADPVFAAAWDRAVRYRVMEGPPSGGARDQSRPDPTALAAALAEERREERRERRQFAAIGKRLDADARAAREAEQRRIKLEVVASRARAALQRQAEIDAGRRREARLARAVGHLPAQAGPEREAAFRRFIIEDAERRAHAADGLDRAKGSARPPQRRKG